MILPTITGADPGPFVLLADSTIADRAITHDVSLAALGFNPIHISRSDLRLYAPRYAYAPAEIVPIFCAAEKREMLDCLVIHDAQTLEQLRVVEFPAGTFSGDASCKTFGAGGCEYPKVIDLDTAGLPAGLLIVNLVTVEGRLSQPLQLLLRLPATERGGPRVALMHPSFTWQAYNTEGGASFYTEAPPRPLFSVSLRRPIDQRAVYDHHNARSCMPFMRLFDEAQIAARHFCNYDLHSDAGFLDDVEVLVLCGHDEYWTKELRANIDAFLARGGRIACFSGNTNWWQTKLLGETLYLSQEGSEAPEPEFSGTGYMFQPWIDNPIEPKLGLGYVPGGYSLRYYHTEKQAEERGISPEDYGTSRGITVADATHPIFAGTGLRTGDVFGVNSDVMHVEIDAAFLRADGRLDKTRWKFTPRNLKVLGRSLIFTASFPSMNFDPAGLFHVGAVLVEVPGNKSRGAVIHGGSVGWYRALAQRDPACSRIVANTVRYLLDAPKVQRGSAKENAERSPIPAELPRGNADFNRRALLRGASALGVAAALPAARAQTLSGEPTLQRPALRTLAEWRNLRLRVAGGDTTAMVELAIRLLADESIGSESIAEIYALLDNAADIGDQRALAYRYMLANDRIDGLNPLSAEISALRERLRQVGFDFPGIIEAVNALNTGDQKTYARLREKFVMEVAPSEASRTLLAAELVAPSQQAPDYTTAANLIGPSPTTPLGLAIQGQALAASGYPRDAAQAFEAASRAGYQPARMLLARLHATKGGPGPQRQKALLELQSLGRAGLTSALLTGVELAVQNAASLADLSAFFPGLKALADKGYGNAAYLVGLAYAAGNGVATDPAKAVEYLQLCATSKHRFAEFQLGVWAYEGYGGPVDKAAAAKFFQSAAEQGEPRAKHNLGLMLVDGDGIPADTVRGNELLGRPQTEPASPAATIPVAPLGFE